MSKPHFLTEILFKDVYLTQPDGFIDSKESGKGYASFNDPYDELMKVSRNWNIRFYEVINGYNFIKNK